MDKNVIKNSLSLFDKIKKFFSKPDFSDIDYLEQILIEADIDILIVDRLINELKSKRINNYTEAVSFLKQYFISELSSDDMQENSFSIPFVILLVGINGSGKTTTASKLAYFFKQQNKKVLFIAGDTFRVAAIEQLEIWAKRADVEIIKGNEGNAPSSVIYDGLSHAKKINYDVVIIDTAGRIHTMHNLIQEIEKIKKTILKFVDEKKLFSLLVVDACTGKNSYNQAKIFNGALKLNGIILTKLDSSSKAGAIIKIKKELSLPVKFITFGEKLEDIEAFDAVTFIERIFN